MSNRNVLGLFTKPVLLSVALGLSALGGAMTTTQASAQAITCGEPYAIVRGDTLGAISQRAFGDGRLSALYERNRGVIGPNPDAIDIGMVLEIPCELTTPAAVATAPAVEAEAAPETQTAAAAATPAATAASDVVPTINMADFAGSEGTDPDADEFVALPDAAEVLLVFNKASAPKFIINVGIVDPYLEQVARVTEGRVQFIEPVEPNRDPTAQLDLVLSGEADAAYIYNGYLEDTHPLLQLPMQPLMGGTAEQTAGALWRLHENYLSDTDYFPGVQLMGFIGAPAAHIWRLRDAEVTPGEDVVNANEYTVPYFDGLDTRGAAAVREENATWLADFDEERGNPLTFAMAHGAARAGGIWNENRSVTEIENGVYTPTFSVVISDAAWARISEADQAAIRQISGEPLSLQSIRWDEFDNGHRRLMIEQGLEVVKADVELLAELQDRSRTGLETWINHADRKGVSGFEAFKFYSENLQTLSRPSEF